MAVYDQEALLNQRFRIGDKPNYESKIFKTDPVGTRDAADDLLMVSVRWPRYSSGFIYTETLATIAGDPGRIIWYAPSSLVREDEGEIVVAAFPDSGSVSTIDVGISDVDTTVAITTTAGTVPPIGFYKINDEVGEYTLTGSTVNFTNRGTLGTNAASHSLGDTILFAQSKETVQSPIEFRVFRDNG